MKKLLNLSILAILGLILTFSACGKDDDIVPVNEYPYLVVWNEVGMSYMVINSVSLVGYEFDSLSIASLGGSQSLVLDKGMPDGYEDINVTDRYGFGRQFSDSLSSASIIVDFKNGKRTKITLNNSSDGTIYLE